MYLFLTLVLALFHCPQVVRYGLEPALRELYFVGPRLKGYGFWNGLPPADICAQITQTSAEMWNMVGTGAKCILLLEQNFQAFYTGAYALLYLCTLYYTLSTWQQTYFFHHQVRLLQTTMKEIKNC
jgi:hypothetical protein